MTHARFSFHSCKKYQLVHKKEGLIYITVYRVENEIKDPMEYDYSDLDQLYESVPVEDRALLLLSKLFSASPRVSRVEAWRANGRGVLILDRVEAQK